jgi:hypothetical protein
MARAGGIWLTRRNSKPTRVLASRRLCGSAFVVENVRRRHRESSRLPARLPYAPKVSPLVRRTPVANGAAKFREAPSKRPSATAFGLKYGRSAAEPGL